MNELFFFCCAVLFSSAIIAAISLGLAAAEKRYLHWPFFWTTSIILVIATSLLATLFYSSPALLPTNSLSLSSLHAPLGPVEVVAWTSNGATDQGNFAAIDISTSVNVIYVFGLLMMLLRLINGRFRAARIAADADHRLSASGVEFWVTSRSVSPYVIRLFSGPHLFKIVVPKVLSDSLSTAEIDNILAHEMAHVRRHDDETGLLLRVLVAVTWFTPVTHLLFHRWAQSIELLCDHEVINNAPPASRKIYAKTLIKTLHLSSTASKQSAVYHFPVASFSSKRLKNEKLRIEKIVRGHNSGFNGAVHRFIIAGIALLMSLATAVAFSAGAESECLRNRESIADDNEFGLHGRVTSRFGAVIDPFNQNATRNHKGIDIAAPQGTIIHAPQNAVVIAATDLFKNKPAYGRVVVLQSEGNVLTLLAHLDDYKVRSGQRVRAGDRIATVGSSGNVTGAHVHIETIQHGKRVDPATVWTLIN